MASGAGPVAEEEGSQRNRCRELWWPAGYPFCLAPTVARDKDELQVLFSSYSINPVNAKKISHRMF